MVSKNLSEPLDVTQGAGGQDIWETPIDTPWLDVTHVLQRHLFIYDLRTYHDLLDPRTP